MGESREDLRRRLDRAEAILAGLRDEEVDAVVGRSGVSVLRVREIEQALRESEERLRIAMDAAELGSWELKLPEEQVSADPRFCEMFGIPPEDAPDTNEEWLARIVEEDRERARRRLQRSVAQGERFEIECRVRRPDGEIRWLHSQGAPVTDELEECIRVIGVAADVTERKRKEERLRRREQRLRLATMIGGIGTWHLDIESGHLDLSGRARVIYGLPLEGEVTVDDVLANVHPEDLPRVQRAVTEATRNGTETETEYRVFHPDGSRHWVSVRYQTICDREGRPTANVGVAVDTTEQKMYEGQLKAFNESLEQRVAERTAEVRDQAEQLRALASQLSRAEQRERKRLARILHDHIQQLLAAARMQLKSIKPGQPHARRRTAIQRACETLDEAMKASRDLSVDLSPPVLHEAGLVAALEWLASRMRKRNQFPVNVRANDSAGMQSEETRFLLFECVRELLFNSMKHSGAPGAEVELTRKENGCLQIRVRDEGKGFDPDLLEKRGADDATFGLFSIQERLQFIGGRMEIDTAPGQGTTITLVAPTGGLQTTVEQKPPARPKKQKSPGPMAQTAVRRVLVVDDHELLREGLVELFESEPDIHVVGEAADGPQAIEMAAELEPDVIIMDVNLGEMSGIVATETILARDPRPRIIGLSMHTDDDIARAMREAGASDFLTKDGPSDELIAAVRNPPQK